MLLLLGLLLRVLTFGTQVNPANGLRFNFADVQQCGPVMISFAGSNITNSVPSSLAIIPVNSTAISIPLADPAVVSSGIALTFLPFPAGTKFVASLDDNTGENIISVSDLIRVLPSTSGNSSCVPAPAADTQRLFNLISPVSQCEEITISYDASVVSEAPNVRLYNPKGRSFLLNLTSDDPTSGLATYIMNFSRGREIVLLMEDRSGVRETSPLVTVAGDSASDTTCLKRTNVTSTGTGNNDSANNVIPAASRRAVIIGSATGGSAVFLVGLCMAIFVVRDRRRRRKVISVIFDPSQMEKAPENEKAAPSQPEYPGLPHTPGLLANPFYTSNTFSSMISSTQQRGSMASWAQVVPEDQRRSASFASQGEVAVQSRRPLDRDSLESLDIEGMLNMATLQSENSSRKNAEGTILGPTMPSPIARPEPPPAFLRTQTSRRHLRNPSDVPAGPDSIVFSGYSVNPFDPHASITGSIFQSPADATAPVRVSGESVGLPSSPRDGGPSRGRKLSGISSTSSSDWYGVAK